jgi:hypothetical protein
MLQAAPLHKTVMAAIPRAFIVDRVCKDERLGDMVQWKTPLALRTVGVMGEIPFFEKKRDVHYD